MFRVTMGHLRVTVGHIRVTLGHFRVNIGHLMVTISKHKANTTELHAKVRQTFFLMFVQDMITKSCRYSLHIHSIWGNSRDTWII